MSAQPNDRKVPEHELYQKVVLEHARSPHNFGPLETATHSADGINQLCGDKLSIYLEVNEQGHIAAVRFEGTGCAISLASASLLTDAVDGCSKTDALALKAHVVDMLEAPPGEDVDMQGAAEALAALQGVRQFPSRVKCATLAWQALALAIDDEKTSRTVTTE